MKENLDYANELKAKLAICKAVNRMLYVHNREKVKNVLCRLLEIVAEEEYPMIVINNFIKKAENEVEKEIYCWCFGKGYSKIDNKVNGEADNDYK